jgi:uncharacterized protein YbjT (DUF2867 family)
MKVILFGATGMVGQGVLRECLLDEGVERVLAVARRSSGLEHEKLRELVLTDFFDYSAAEKELAGYDACFFCLGVSSAGMTEADYAHVTYDLTLAAARTLARLNPGMTFNYVSGAGTDSSEKGRLMWARVKGRTENDLMRLGFKAVCLFRPAFIQPMHGIVSKTSLYRLFYAVLGWLFPLFKLVIPDYVTTTEQVGRAMIRAAKYGVLHPIVENRDINELSKNIIEGE